MEQPWFARISSWFTPKTWLSMGLGLIVAALLVLSGCARSGAEQTIPTTVPDATPTQEGSASEPSASSELSTQQSDAGRVTIDVTPLTLSGVTWEFEVALNTHSVDLGFDLTKVGALRCDRGQEFEAIAWDGSGPGGHHRSGVLKFAAPDHPISYVEVVIRDVAKVSERTFKWEVPGEAGPSMDGDVTQSAPSAGPDGVPQVTLSDTAFHFGNVPMSRGAVEQAIEITNTGGDVLRIESVEPT